MNPITKKVAVAAGIGAVAGVLYYKLSGKVPRPPGPPKVFLFGDSHSVGLDIYMKKLAAADGVAYASDPRGGSGAPLWTSHIDADLSMYKPTVAVFSLGGNDTYKPTPERVPLVQAGVKHIVEAIRAAGAVPVWLESPRLPWPDTIGDREMWLDALAANGGLHFPGSAFDDEPRDDIHVHLTLPGYERWANDVWSRLKRADLID